MVSQPSLGHEGERPVERSEQQLHGHRVTIEPDAGEPSRIVVLVGERKFPARLDPDVGWSCAALPFVGHASPAALAERLAASFSAGEGEG
jgi:hypothetical protein